MKLKKARTCENCRALEVNGKCELGFNNRGPYGALLGMRTIKPQEPCYKPTTIPELFEARDARNGR